MFFLPTAGAHSGSGFAALERNGDIYLKCYNGTGGSLAAGTLVYLKQVYSATEANVHSIVALVDDAKRHVIGCVDDLRASSFGGTTASGAIADASLGWIKVKGRVTATTASITTVQGDYLKVLNGAVAAGGAADPFIDDAFAFANEASTATTHDMTLLGREFLAST